MGWRRDGDFAYSVGKGEVFFSKTMAIQPASLGWLVKKKRDFERFPFTLYPCIKRNPFAFWPGQQSGLINARITLAAAEVGEISQQGYDDRFLHWPNIVRLRKTDQYSASVRATLIDSHITKQLFTITFLCYIFNDTSVINLLPLQEQNIFWVQNIISLVSSINIYMVCGRTKWQ